MRATCREDAAEERQRRQWTSQPGSRWAATQGWAARCSQREASRCLPYGYAVAHGNRSLLRLSFADLLCLMLAPIWWLLRRFDVYGPALGAQEVTFWLVWISLFGWIAPLLTTAFFFALASPEPVAIAENTRVSGAPVAATPLDDPARQTYPFGPTIRGGVWLLWTMAPHPRLISRSESH